jgi:hypothetical protein
MAEQVSRSRIVIAKVAVALTVVFLALGLALHGLSTDVLSRFWQNLVDRPGGPMTFRFFLQPVMAGIAAYVDGARDARAGRPPFLRALIADPSGRVDRMNEAVIATSRIILLGLTMDLIYQYLEFDAFKPGEAAVVAILLAFVPYLLLRGPFTRLARHRLGRGPAAPGGSSDRASTTDDR